MQGLAILLLSNMLFQRDISTMPCDLRIDDVSSAHNCHKAVVLKLLLHFRASKQKGKPP